MDDDTYIPRRLNDSWKWLWFDADVATVALSVWMLAVVANHFLVGMCFGALAGWLMMKLKSDKHPAYALHLAYWYLPAEMMPLHCTPPSHRRQMIG